MFTTAPSEQQTPQTMLPPTQPSSPLPSLSSMHLQLDGRSHKHRLTPHVTDPSKRQRVRDPNEPNPLYAFTMQYYPTQTSRSTRPDLEKINGALGIHIHRIKVIETPRDGFVAAFAVKTHVRLRDLRKRLTATLYNEIDRPGLQIAGSYGLRIYANDKTDPEAQALHAKYTEWIKRAFERTDDTTGRPVGMWSLEQKKSQSLPRFYVDETGNSVRHESGEDMLAQHLQQWANTHQLPMLWTRRNRTNPEADREQCGTFRADFTYELEDQRVVLLEHDENAHRSYALDREIKRQPLMALGFGERPVTFIRYNPDVRVPEEERLALLLRRLQASMAPAPVDDSHFKHFITVEYLFYPRIEGGGSDDAVQTFRFKTPSAYERWAVLRMTGMPLLGDPVFSDDDDADNNFAASSIMVSDTDDGTPKLVDTTDVETLKARLERAEARVRELEGVEARVHELEWQLAAVQGE